MLCNISQNAMGQTPGGGGVPCQVQPGGGGTLPGPAGGGGVPCPGGGGTQLGQHREYLLHGGRYASCGTFLFPLFSLRPISLRSAMTVLALR